MTDSIGTWDVIRPNSLLKPRYVVAYYDGSGGNIYLVGAKSDGPMVEGWYVIMVDDEGRQAFIDGPRDDPNDFMRLSFAMPVAMG